MVTIDPNNILAVLNAQFKDLKKLQLIQPDKQDQILIKAIEGKWIKGEDFDLYGWMPFVNIWHKLNEPIYTRGILPNELLFDPDTPEWAVMKEEVSKLCRYFGENHIPFTTSFSGGKGIHVSIYFGSIQLDDALLDEIKETDIDFYKTVRKALVEALAERAGVDLKAIQIDWGKINFNSKSKGSQVRTFGTTRAPGLYKTLIEEIPDHKPEPYELPLIFPEKPELWEIENTEFKEVVINALKAEVKRAKKENEYNLDNVDYTGTEIMSFYCIKKLHEAGLRNGRYYAAEALILLCKKCGIPKETAEKYARDLFKTFPGITQAETDLRIQNALTIYESDKNFSCRVLKEHFPDLKLCNFSKCPIKEKIEENNQSPEKEGKKNSGEGKPNEIKIHFDEVAKQIRKDNHIFSMRDNKQIYLYQGGVYKSEGAEAILDTQIRDAYNLMFINRWKEVNPEFDLPEHIPEATAKYVTEVLAYIRAYTHITRDSIELDQTKYLNFKNCLLNLETWETEEHNPKIKSICQIPVNFNSNAECPKITDFLKSVVTDSDIDLLCEIAGYCLTTDCSFQKAFMLYGGGSNGKSVFLALLEALIGGENTSAESLQKLEFDKYRTAKLYGKRVNICGDIPDGKMHKTDVFKKLTSGLDLIDGENKYQNSFQFRNTAKLVFSANVLPEGKKDRAYYRRWILINFPHNFEGKNDDKSLITKLRDPEELSGFLNLALEGLRRIKKNGKFTNEKSIEDTQKEYESNSDPIAAFMDECTEASQEDIDAIHLYSTYTQWARVNNKKITAYNQWAKELKRLGYENYRENESGSNCKKKNTYWNNLKIRSEAQDRLNWKSDKQACPNYTVSLDIEKTNLGQAGQALPLLQTCLQDKPYCRSCVCYTQGEDKKGDGIGKENGDSGNLLTNNPEACPKMRFFDSGGSRTSSESNLENMPVLKQKTIISEQESEEYNINKVEDLSLMRRDLKNYVSTYLRKYGGVESTEILVGGFLKEYPGYLQLFPRQAIIFEAEKICKTLSQSISSIDNVAKADSGLEEQC